MAESPETPRRRSGRAAKPNKKYIVDPFQAHAELLADELNTPPARPLPDKDEGEGSDDEFNDAQAARELAEAAADDDGGSDSEDGDEGENDDEDRDEDEEDEDAPHSRPIVRVVRNGTEDDHATPPSTTTTKPPVTLTPLPKPGRRKQAQKDNAVKKKQNFGYHTLPIFDPLGNTGAKGRDIHYTRGVPEATNATSREKRVVYAVGTGEEDLTAYVKARDWWGAGGPLPSRKACVEKVIGEEGSKRKSAKNEDGPSGLAHSPWYPGTKRKREAKEEMAWYYEDGGSEAFAKAQVLAQVDKEFAPNNHGSNAGDGGIVAGPLDDQKLFQMPAFGGSWNLGEAHAGSRKAEKMQAWVMNVGARVQGLEWVPNQHGNMQYIAVAPSQNSRDTFAFTDANGRAEDEVRAPAYTPLVRRQQCLQIWEVNAEMNRRMGSKIDFTHKPKINTVYSTDWGYIKKMKWCPVPDRSEDGKDRLGFLGCIFSDGALRVLDLPKSIPRDSTSCETEHVHIEKVAFSSKPPEMLATCITWLSSRSIAIGTSDGHVSVYTIPDAILDSAKAGTTKNAHAWQHTRAHLTYISNLTSLYPSRPHLLATHSLDGFIRLTDLRHPLTDTATAQRSRIAQGPLAWHDISQSVVNVDDNFAVKCYGVRTFYKAQSVARVGGFGSEVSASGVHATLAVASVEGAVWCLNPLRRLGVGKGRVGVIKVLGCEWRRPVVQVEQAAPVRSETARDADSDVMTEIDGEADSATRKGLPEDNDNDKPYLRTQPDFDSNSILTKPLIRLTQGYSVQTSDLSSTSNSTKEGKDSQYVSFATVYEEKTAVTSVCWNPNLVAGTWLASGTGSGLVVIQDVAID